MSQHVLGELSICVRCGAEVWPDGRVMAWRAESGFAPGGSGWERASDDCDLELARQVTES